MMAQAGAVRAAPPPMIARAHHGSVSKEQRALIEEELKPGRLPVRGRDQQPRARHRHGRGRPGRSRSSRRRRSPAALQRVGRAGHQVGAVSRGVLFPKHRGDLVPDRGRRRADAQRRHRGAARARATRSTCSPSRSWRWSRWTPGTVDDLFAVVRRRGAVRRRCRDRRTTRRSTCSPAATRRDEFAELRPRLVWDRVAGTLTGRPGAQRLAVTSGGTIPDRGLFGVFLVGEKASRVGELDEEMVYESRVGDVFTLGSTSLADRGHHPRPGAGLPRARPARAAAVLEGRRARPAGRARPRGRRVRPRAGRARRAEAREPRCTRRRPRRVGRRQPARLPRRAARGHRPRCPTTARSWSSGSATSSATGGSSCTRPTARRSTRRGRWRSPRGCASGTASTPRRCTPTTASCCGCPRPTRTRRAPTLVVFEPDEIEDARHHRGRRLGAVRVPVPRVRGPRAAAAAPRPRPPHAAVAAAAALRPAARGRVASTAPSRSCSRRCASACRTSSTCRRWSR